MSRDHDREDPLNIDIQVRPLSGPRLVRDYLAGTGRAGEFFHGSPFSLGAFQSKRDEVLGRFGPEERARAAAALQPTSATARERLERFVREGGAMVTTGQQTGFLTGPLYTIYKALTTVRLAEELEASLGLPVLPVFWMASEDHDWAEANHAFLLDERSRLRRLELPSSDPRALPMSARPLETGVRQVLDELGHILSGTEFVDDYLKLVRDAYRPGRSVAGAFAELMRELLAPFDVLLVDAADPQLKRASASVLEHALLGAQEHERVLRGRSEELLRAGYHAQVAVLEGATNLFFHGTGERERLYRAGSGFRTHDSGFTMDLEEARGRLAVEPELFSPNVFLRPVVESAVFPTLAYVAGPGEISYFAQLDAMFADFGIQPPVVFPRYSATLVSPETQRALERLDLTSADLVRPRHELAVRLARRAVPAPVRAELEALGAAIADGYRRLTEEAAVVDPTLIGALGALRNDSLARLADAERKIVRRVRDRERVTMERLDRVRAHLRPNEEPQERVLSAVGLLARYGPGLLHQLMGTIGVEWVEGAPVP